ncbi:MAG: MlaD family protein [Pseudomonadota bacterium]
MSEPKTLTIEDKKYISPVWVIPIVAILIGLWLGYKSLSEKGPVISITFDNASGVAVSKTEVRYKDVTVGKVTEVTLSDDLKTVKIKAEMDKEMKHHLSPETRFWVVRPQVTIGKISGLSTLFSGVYIAMDPGPKGPFTKRFTGLENPPPIDSEIKGKTFVLRARTLGSIQQGSPIYFRQIKAGEITSFHLDEKDGWVEIEAFVTEPYAQWVNKRSRFWNVSGFNISINASGIEAQTGSLTSLIQGGVAFDEGPVKNNPAADKSYFYLYSNYKAVLDGDYTVKYPYVLHFKESVRGLTAGATVEYKGIKVGRVTNVELQNIQDVREYGVNVFIEIEPQRFDPNKLINQNQMNQEVKNLIDQGLRAQLQIGSLLTGALYVDLIERKDEAGMMMTDNRSDIPEIPTVLGQHKKLTEQLSDITDKINKFPIDQIGNELSASLGSLQRILATLEEKDTADAFADTINALKETSQKLDQAAENGNRLMQSLDGTLAQDGKFMYELETMMEEIRRAAQSLESLTTTLNEEPDALIFGKGRSNEDK